MQIWKVSTDNYIKMTYNLENVIIRASPELVSPLYKEIKQFVICFTCKRPLILLGLIMRKKYNFKNKPEVLGSQIDQF